MAPRPLAVPGASIRLGPEALARLMPMYLWLDPGGIIRACGPTLAKVAGDAVLIGRPFDEVFRLKRPVACGESPAAAGPRLLVALPGRPGRWLRAEAVSGADGEGLLLNLSFGYSVAEAVREHGLTERDFAATDLAMEMLFLLEARAAVAKENRALTMRLQGAREVAEAQALTDTLTGLGNRRALDRAMARAAASGQDFALLHIDIDFFKQVNDSLGHGAGDRVLIELADILRRTIRDSDCAARIGGDEFVVLIAGSGSRAHPARVAERILAAMHAAPALDGDERLPVSLSIGIALSPAYGEPPDTGLMLEAADAALYRSKRAGRGRISFAPPSHAMPVASGQASA